MHFRAGLPEAAPPPSLPPARALGQPQTQRPVSTTSAHTHWHYSQRPMKDVVKLQPRHCPPNNWVPKSDSCAIVTVGRTIFDDFRPKKSQRYSHRWQIDIISPADKITPRTINVSLFVPLLSLSLITRLSELIARNTINNIVNCWLQWTMAP